MTLTIDSKLLNQTEYSAFLTADQVQQVLARAVLDTLGPVPPTGAVHVLVDYTPNQVQGSDKITVSATVKVVVDHIDTTAPPKVTQVTRRQAIQALITQDLDDKVEAAINAIADVKQQKLTRAWYQDSLVFERGCPELASMATTLGLTDAQVDDLFTLAATL